jgi:endo-1,4-beta-xylanase
MTSEKTLRQLAEQRGVKFGTALGAEPLREDSNYWNTARREFTSVTTSSALKMGPLRPEPGTYDFTDADAIVDFGNRYDMSVRGHTLVWHTQKPDWYQEATGWCRRVTGASVETSKSINCCIGLSRKGRSSIAIYPS